MINNESSSQYLSRWRDRIYYCAPSGDLFGSNSIEERELCDENACVEFDRDGLPRAGCEVLDAPICPEGVDKMCHGTLEVYCSPDRKPLFNLDCVEWARYMNWSAEDPIQDPDLSPICAENANPGPTLGPPKCALSNEACEEGQSRCVTLSSGRSVPLHCKSGVWSWLETSCQECTKTEEGVATCVQ